MIELHRHLDVSVRSSTLLKLAQERGLESPETTVEEFRSKFILNRPFQNLSEVLSQFTLFQQVLDRPDVLEQVAYEVIEDCYAEGMEGVELRFSPGFVAEQSKLRWEDVLDGFEAGLKRALQKFPKIKAGLICIATRDYGIGSAEKTIEFFLKHQERFIGVDLAGNEEDFPCRQFARVFQRVKKSGGRITIHAGEASGPESIWEAIEDLGADRIGHGISCVQDPELMKTLADRKICLEMCPTSNWLIGAVPDLSQHPLPQVLRAGIPVTVNTDDPGIFGVSLGYEVSVCRTQMGLSQAEIELCAQHSRNATFLQ